MTRKIAQPPLGYGDRSLDDLVLDINAPMSDPRSVHQSLPPGSVET